MDQDEPNFPSTNSRHEQHPVADKAGGQSLLFSQDPKLRQWPMMGSIAWPATVVGLYLTMVYHGRNWLKNSSAESSAGQKKISKGTEQAGPKSQLHAHHHIKSQRKELPWTRSLIFSIFLVFYNMSMAALNAWIAFELVHCALKSGYNFLCQLVYTGTDHPYETRIAIAIWWYFASKGIELLDTVLIILKRKSSQLTFLHIYHHSTMFIVWWVGAKFVPGGSAVTGALVNCIVHVLMYTYYALASMGPRLQPYLWWKKYLTIIQLIQFMMGVTLGLNSILTGCRFTRWMQYVFVCYAFSFLILFGNFYRRTYSRSLSASKKIQQQKLVDNEACSESAKDVPSSRRKTNKDSKHRQTSNAKGKQNTQCKKRKQVKRSHT